MRWAQGNVKYTLACTQERFSRKTEAADLTRAFTLLDAKGDGKVDANELGMLFRRLGHKEKRVLTTPRAALHSFLFCISQAQHIENYR
jgi:hypothetical protein